MKKHTIIFVLLALTFVLLEVQVFAAPKEETTIPSEEKLKKAAEEANKPLSPNNFEVIVKNNTGSKLTGWTGQIFSITNAKAVGDISPTNQRKHLPLGNYVLMLRFKEDIPELKGQRPFTFTITKDKKTVFTLIIGASSEPEMEFDVDRHGSDYASFWLLEDRPEVCLAKCKKDPKCKAYTFVKAGIAGKNAHCWLKHGIPAPVYSHGSVSGVIQRDSSPYRVRLRYEKLVHNK